ncbi:lambda exonuclease family protein [Cupriavidus sp. Marseille-Q8015]
MIVIDCEQGTKEWFAARAGVCTASMYRTACTLKQDGKPTDAMLNYAFRLAVERLTGEPSEGAYETWAMRRGKELEPDARIEHQARIGRRVVQVGMYRTEDGKFGASPDGLIATDGGAEYKCLVSPDELRTTILDNDLAFYMHQVQGCMWMTGRNWWDFCVYCPTWSAFGRSFSRWRVPRDDNFIDKMVDELMRFDGIVCDYMTRLQKQTTL